MGAALSVVGAGEGDGGVDGHTGIVGGEAELLTRLAVDGVVEFGVTGGAFGVGGVETELDGLAEGVRSGVKPVGFAPGGMKYFDDHRFGVLTHIFPPHLLQCEAAVLFDLLESR
jgi:hypothetical protein